MKPEEREIDTDVTEMSERWHVVEMTSLPECDLCKYEDGKAGVTAVYDGKTNRGPWAYMCEKHWMLAGPGKTGEGFGQRLRKVQ